jgi:hypothetical protein
MIAMVILFVGSMITATVFDFPIWISKLGAGVALVLLISGLVFTGMGEMYVFKLRNYKKDIQSYRHRVIFMKCIEYIKANDFESAVDLYNSYKASSDIKIFLYSYIVIARLYSSDPVQRELGEKRLNELKDKWNPDNIKF